MQIAAFSSTSIPDLEQLTQIMNDPASSSYDILHNNHYIIIMNIPYIPY